MDHTKPEGYSSWNTIYPIYINSCRTKAKGRRISKEFCCDNPTISEVENVITKMGFGKEDMIREEKFHPKAKEKWTRHNEYNEMGSLKLDLKSESKREFLKQLPDLVIEHRANAKNNAKNNDSGNSKKKKKKRVK